MKQQHIDRLIIAVLALHLLYTNTLLLEALNPSMIGWLFTFVILFATSYASLTAVILDRIPNWWLFIIAAVLDGFGVWLEYSHAQNIWIAFYFALYTGLIVIAIGFMKLSTKKENELVNQLAEKVKNLTDINYNISLENNNFTKQLENEKKELENNIKELEKTLKVQFQESENNALRLIEFKKIQNEKKELETKLKELEPYIKELEANIRKLEKVQSENEEILQKYADAEEQIKILENNLKEIKDNLKEMMPNLISKLRQGYKNIENKEHAEKLEKISNILNVPF